MEESEESGPRGMKEGGDVGAEGGSGVDRQLGPEEAHTQTNHVGV